jgi:leucyl-tRNA synthetase
LREDVTFCPGTPRDRRVGEAAEIAGKAPAERPQSFAPAALAVLKAAHRALARVTEDIEKLHFNVCVAAIYEFANALGAAIGDTTGGGARLPLGHARSG